MIWFAEGLVTFIPIIVLYYEISIDAFRFDYDYAWISAAVGGVYAIYWSFVRAYVDLFGSESQATKESDASAAAFIYHTVPELGRYWFVYAVMNLLVFSGLQYLIQVEVVTVTSYKAVV